MSQATERPEPEYLGDAVYGQFEGDMLLLTTDSHLIGDAGNQIYLEPAVLTSLLNYLGRSGIIKSYELT